jgi:ethanolamine ammonia-lyase small subunit
MSEQREIAEVRPNLERFTPARVSLDRTGTAISTAGQLAFQLDHALARDAVHDKADFAALLKGLQDRGLEALSLASAVTGGRGVYLRRPDLGRKLASESAEELRRREDKPSDVVFLIADGLSALAVDRHALPLLDAILPKLPPELTVAPVCLVRNARVAVGDEIGFLLKVKLAVVLIGERPGLSAPDSLGVYVTWEPQPGRTDAERNCISNIRLEGLGYEDAAARILFYMNAARAIGSTGFALKESASPNLPAIG